MNLLTLDPGKQFFAYSIFIGNKLKKTGMLVNKIDSFKEKELTNKVKLFSDEIESLLNSYPIEQIVAERYLVRSGLLASRTGGNCEFISFMLGVIARICKKRKIQLFLITPAVWKAFCYRQYGFDKKTSLTEVFGFYGLSKNFTTIPIKEHQFDTLGSACYWVWKNEKVDIYKKTKKKIVKLWKKGKPTNKVALKSYNKVVLK